MTTPQDKSCTTQEKLNQYRSLVQEVEELRERLRTPMEQSTVLQLNARLAICLEIISQADSFVMSVNDSLTRRILRYKYLDGPYAVSWQQVAQYIGGGNSADSVRKVARRCIKSHR